MEIAQIVSATVKTAPEAYSNYSISFAGPNKVELQFVRTHNLIFGKNQKFSIQK